MVKRKFFSAGLLSASCILFFACTGDSGSSSSKSLISCSAKVDAVTFTCVEMSEADAANYLTEASCADVVGTSLNYGFSTGCESGATISCPVTIGNKTATVYLYSEGVSCDDVSAEDYLPVLLSSSSDALSSSSEETVPSSSSIEVLPEYSSSSSVEIIPESSSSLLIESSSSTVSLSSTPGCTVEISGLFGETVCITSSTMSETDCSQMNMTGMTATYSETGCSSVGVTATCEDSGTTTYYYKEGASCED